MNVGTQQRERVCVVLRIATKLAMLEDHDELSCCWKQSSRSATGQKMLLCDCIGVEGVLKGKTICVGWQ